LTNAPHLAGIKSIFAGLMSTSLFFLPLLLMFNSFENLSFHLTPNPSSSILVLSHHQVSNINIGTVFIMTV
jgi:hypothetical protein